MLVGAVVRDPVEDQLDVARVACGDELVEVLQCAEDRVDVAVVGDVVAEVGHRRREDRAQPDRPDPQPGEVVEACAVMPADPPPHRRWNPRRSADRSGRWRPAATRPAQTCTGLSRNVRACARPSFGIVGLLFTAAAFVVFAGDSLALKAIALALFGIACVVAVSPSSWRSGRRRTPSARRRPRAAAAARPARRRGRAPRAPPPAAGAGLPPTTSLRRSRA